MTHPNTYTDTIAQLRTDTFSDGAWNGHVDARGSAKTVRITATCDVSVL